MTAKTAKPCKWDLKKDHKELFTPPAEEPGLVDVPELLYVWIEGKGYPGKAPDFRPKVEVLYGLAYTIKFMLKLDKARPFEFAVAPMSGLYHAADPAAFLDPDRGGEWEWTLGIPLPYEVTAAVFENGREALKRKKDPEFLLDAYLKRYAEGLSAQIMHIGPYSAEGPTIRKLHAYFQGLGYTFNGPHHEIYLGDPRRTAPDRLKTVLRQPVRKA